MPEPETLDLDVGVDVTIDVTRNNWVQPTRLRLGPGETLEDFIGRVGVVLELLVLELLVRGRVAGRKPNTGRTGYAVVRVLPVLEGKAWNDLARAYMRALRPSRVRVVEHGKPRTDDAVSWRVTVYLHEDGTVRRVEQEVEVDLPDGVEHGWHLDCLLVSGQRIW